MNFQPDLFIAQMQDVLYNLRQEEIQHPKYEMRQASTDNFGINLYGSPRLINRIAVQQQWRIDSHINISFYLQRISDGYQFLIEQWSIQSEEVDVGTHNSYQPVLFMRQFMTLLSLSSVMNECSVVNMEGKFRITDDFTFNKQKQIEWLRPKSLGVLGISRTLGFCRITVNVAFQRGILDIVQSLSQVVISLPKRPRFMSQHRMMEEGNKIKQNYIYSANNQQQEESDKQKQTVSLFSRVYDVEIISTPEEIGRIISKLSKEDYEIENHSFLVHIQQLKEKLERKYNFGVRTAFIIYFVLDH